MVSRIRIPSLSTVLVAFACGWGCTSQAHIHSIQSPSAHFGRYRTVAFEAAPLPPKGFALSPRTTEVRQHIEDEATRVLKDRGYTVVPMDQRADLVVRIEAGRRDQWVPTTTGRMDVGAGVAGNTAPMAASPIAGGGPSATVPGPGQLDTGYHGELDQEARDRVDGAFVIDVFAGDTRQLVWHGAARREVDPANLDYTRLNRTVDAVLSSLPARTGP